MKNIELVKNTYILKDSNSFIVYCPYNGKIARVDDNPANDPALYGQLEKACFFGDLPPTVNKTSEFSGFNSLYLMLTRRCNLKCIYCYASAGMSEKDTNVDMPEKLALDATSYYLDQLKSDYLNISFHGGGEPTLEQDTIRSVVALINKERGKKNRKIYLVTNGTANKKTWDWLMENKISISISIDGPPSIQDRNRPFKDGSGSSRIVENSIRYLVEKDYSFGVRITYAAPDNITTILRYLNGLGVKFVHIEPLFPYGREYQDIDSSKPDPYPTGAPTCQQFVENFIKAMDCAKEFKMTLFNSHLINFAKGIGYFCEGARAKSMMVTHDGFLTGCMEVVDSKDKDFSVFNYGHYTNQEANFVLDKNKIRKMNERHVDNISVCKECFARYVCAGGCAVKAVRDQGSFMARNKAYCSFTQLIVPVLIQRISSLTGI